MNRAQRRASKHKSASLRRPVSATTWAQVVVDSAVIHDALADTIAIRVRDAFAQLRAGSTDEDLFNRLAMVINLGIIRSESIDPLLEQTMLDGRDALMECAALQARHGRYGFTGPGLSAMESAIDAYEAILRASTPLQMQQAMDTALKRMRLGHMLEAAHA